MKEDQTNRQKKNPKTSRWYRLFAVLFLCVAGFFYLLGRSGDAGNTDWVSADAEDRRASDQISADAEDDHSPYQPTENLVPDQSAGEEIAEAYSVSIVDEDPAFIPDYGGEDVIVLEGNVPRFNAYDMSHIEGMHFSELDELGRCGTAYAMLTQSMMPTGERESIRDIRPSGWHTYSYPELVEDEFLYNRSHLLAYAMTGQNANVKNLITGTEYFNQVTMQDYEKIVLRYLDRHETEGVLYRVSPLFRAEELVARGVEMEAYSVADEGESVCYHVFVYNIHPGIEIDYATGETWVK